MSVWRGVSQLGAFVVRVTARFRSTVDRGPLIAVGSESGGGALFARRRATACLQLISTGQVQTASIPMMRFDVDRRTMTVTP